jgi:hypothetical protein
MTGLYNPARERLAKQIAKLTAARRVAKQQAEVAQYTRLAEEAEASGLTTIAETLRETAERIRKGSK